MFVMASAIGVSIIAFQLVMGTRIPTPPALKAPVLSASFALPSRLTASCYWEARFSEPAGG